MIVKKFVAPALPVPPVDYNQREQTDLIRVLRLYFNLLDSILKPIIDQLNSGEFDDNLSATNGRFQNVFANQGNIGVVNSNAISARAAIINGIRNYRQISQDIMATNFYGGYFYGDGRYLSTPYNQFTSDQDQTGAVATATAVTFNTDDFPDSISIVNNSEITFGQSGIYLLTYSLAFTNPTNDAQDIDIWYRYEGTDIADSNSKFSVPARKSTGNNSYLIAVTPYIVDIPNNGDQVQLMFRVTNASVTLEHLAAVTASPGVTPAIPATPSAILTVQFISAQYPPVQRVAPLPVFGFGQVGVVEVLTNRG